MGHSPTGAITNGGGSVDGNGDGTGSNTATLNASSPTSNTQNVRAMVEFALL